MVASLHPLKVSKAGRHRMSRHAGLYMEVMWPTLSALKGLGLCSTDAVTAIERIDVVQTASVTSSSLSHTMTSSEAGGERQQMDPFGLYIYGPASVVPLRPDQVWSMDLTPPLWWWKGLTYFLSTLIPSYLLIAPRPPPVVVEGAYLLPSYPYPLIAWGGVDSDHASQDHIWRMPFLCMSRASVDLRQAILSASSTTSSTSSTATSTSFTQVA